MASIDDSMSNLIHRLSQLKARMENFNRRFNPRLSWYERMRDDTVNQVMLIGLPANLDELLDGLYGEADVGREN